MTDTAQATLPLSTVAPRLRWQNLPARALQADADLSSQWNRLNAGRGDLPFLCAEALRTALEEFGHGSERLLIARQDDTVAAMLLLVPEGRLRWRTFQPSQIPLGAWVAQPGLRIDDIARSLVRGPLGSCLAVSITQVDPLFAPREADTAASAHADYIDTGWVQLDGSYEQYWAARGKNLRQNMRKQRNKLAAEGTRTTMRVWTRPEDMAPALARYGALESAGWKAAQGTAIGADNDQGRFYRALFESAARRGEAVVYEYLFDERSVALNLCLRRGGVLVVLKTTYDESIKLFSPAFLLREEELQALFADGSTRRVEYYGRLMDWHTKLTENKRTLYHLTAYRWPLVKRLAALRATTRRPSADAHASDAARPAENTERN